MCYCNCPYVTIHGPQVGECARGYDKAGDGPLPPGDAACVIYSKEAEKRRKRGR